MLVLYNLFNLHYLFTVLNIFDLNYLLMHLGYILFIQWNLYIILLLNNVYLYHLIILELKLRDTLLNQIIVRALFLKIDDILYWFYISICEKLETPLSHIFLKYWSIHLFDFFYILFFLLISNLLVHFVFYLLQLF